MTKYLVELLSASVSPSARALYRRAFKLLQEYGEEHCPHIPIWPASEATVANFIAFLFSKNFAASTIISYVSAIASIHKFAAYPDPTQYFLVKKLLSGTQKIKGQQDTRLPVTEPILIGLINHHPKSSLTSYDQKMFKAIFTLAFSAFLRIGEILLRSKECNPDSVVQSSDISFFKSNKRVNACQILMRSWKGRYAGPPLKISLNGSKSVICPVQSLLEFFKVRGFHQGPLFCNKDLTPCSRNYFTLTLKNALKATGHNCNRIKGHSFRIGAATTAAMKGVSDAQIQRLGRWRSSAFNRYIRIPDIQNS